MINIPTTIKAMAEMTMAIEGIMNEMDDVKENHPELAKEIEELQQRILNRSDLIQQIDKGRIKKERR